MSDPLELILANRLRALRRQQGWSLDEMAQRAGVSRASLSRIEKAEVSPTTAVLAKICSAFGLSLSHLLAQVESGPRALVPLADQPLWQDQASGFSRRSVSPPEPGLSCEVLACTLEAGASLHYPQPTRPGLEHHLVMQSGQLRLWVEDQAYDLGPGDCLRYKTFGQSRFQVLGEQSAQYLLVLI